MNVSAHFSSQKPIPTMLKTVSKSESANNNQAQRHLFIRLDTSATLYISDEARWKWKAESESTDLLLKLMESDPDFVQYLRDQAEEGRRALEAKWEAERLAFESRPIDLRIHGNNTRYLVYILRNNLHMLNYQGLHEIELHRDLKEAPVEFRIANNLAFHIGTMQSMPNATHEEKAMFREAAMRMAQYIADNHLSGAQARAFMVEMRTLKELDINSVHGFFPPHDVIRSLNNQTIGRNFYSVLNERYMNHSAGLLNSFSTMDHVARNFDSLINEERFSSVRDWMDRIKADIAQM